MEFDVLTLYPEMFAGPLETSILGRAREKGLWRYQLHQIRDFSPDKHHSVDHSPYGGGAGMVMRADVLYAAWQAAIARAPEVPAYTVLMSPQGNVFQQARAEAFARGIGLASKKFSRLILVCGRFEGVDERFITECVDEEISMGDYVLTGGEIPAMALLDAVVRLIPGALGNSSSAAQESFSESNQGLLEFPHYTFPREFRGQGVPEVLLSGDHAKIAAWRHAAALARTRARRPDLAAKADAAEAKGGKK